jgi:hypothetical protein
VAPSLADLISRAGPPDTDRPAWLAFRRTGITATEVRDLHLGKITADDLAKAKHGGDGPDLSGNVYIAWGNEREPIIAERLRVALGMDPEHRVFHAQENSRHLASPDGVGTDFDELLEISEIKTGGYRYFGHAGMVDKGYLAQMVWAMYVTGAWRCRYEFETREQHPMGGFAPGSSYSEWVVLDDHLDLLERLIAIADAALVVIDAYDVDATRVVDEVLDTHAVNVLRGRLAEADGKALKEQAWQALGEAMPVDEDFVQGTSLARIRWTAPVRGTAETRVVDAEHPDVVAARAALVDAKAALAAVEDAHSTVEEREVVVKPGRLTVSDPQKRKEQSA